MSSNKPKRMNTQQIAAELKNFTNVTRTAYGDFAYAAGFFETTLADVLADLPVSKQAEVIDRIRGAAGSIKPRR